MEKIKKMEKIAKQSWWKFCSEMTEFLKEQRGIDSLDGTKKQNELALNNLLKHKAKGDVELIKLAIINSGYYDFMKIYWNWNAIMENIKNQPKHHKF